MIEHINIKNFKAHADTSIELSNLNILTGMNGVGKSSIIQAILLLRQSYVKSRLSKGLDLNGELCKIGSVSDCIYEEATTDDVEFKIKFQDRTLLWSFKAELNDLSETFMNINNENTYSTSNMEVIFQNNFQYISAFRNGPVNNYIKDTFSVGILNLISRKEGRCELVAHLLYHNRENLVAEALVLDKSLDWSLISQVEAWMRAISENINIHIEPNDTSFKINYSYNRGGKKTKTQEFKASNIGFGVSYVLPIVVAILQACSSPRKKNISKESKLIIIENPEAHIHPSGQAKLMELICKAANSSYNVQFLLETHSDHIINGLLVAVKKEIIPAKKSKVYFFDRDKESHRSQAHLLPVLPGGKIKKAPNGFFDQMDIDMNTLMGF